MTTFNPHLASDMRRDITELQALYDMNALEPDRFRKLLRSLAENINEVEVLSDVIGPEPFVTVPVDGLEKVAADMQRRFDLAVSLPARARSRGIFAVVDGGRA